VRQLSQVQQLRYHQPWHSVFWVVIFPQLALSHWSGNFETATVNWKLQGNCHSHTCAAVLKLSIHHLEELHVKVQMSKSNLPDVLGILPRQFHKKRIHVWIKQITLYRLHCAVSMLTIAAVSTFFLLTYRPTLFSTNLSTFVNKIMSSCIAYTGSLMCYPWAADFQEHASMYSTLVKFLNSTDNTDAIDTTSYWTKVKHHSINWN